MRPTPDYSAWYDYTDSVYEPSEDSFVFLDGIEKELQDKCLEKPGLAVEIGSGSGVNEWNAANNWSGAQFSDLLLAMCD
ncbi:Oidioi.mRNA.OKI2018_I69.PAR.g10079.t2.cds [Oikopleura dioica]|uniref:Oidioi.mRNA.OKI2018_I69.PAR.g10079.t2.cds n=1 Tax=Oikopleura dioica TaxID=34765 RepID=A0ABN7RU20_OIKDI|nr:Oidioi.mRNA.OKI2018_I69.PAR.g10079.t2.cds [Oikopleura dioica]